MLSRRLFVASIASIPFVQPASATDWPRRPIRIIYPYAAGGAANASARLLAHRLSEVLGQAVIVENHVGANGTLAAQMVARAPADGYTLFWATSPQIAISPAMTRVPYDPLKDFTPISAILTNAFGLIVNPQMPVSTIAEFVAYVRARPGKLAYAEGGFGSIGHLSMALFLKRAGLEMTNVSYQGNAPALNDVVAGHLPTMSSVLGDAIPFAASGSIRLLAVFSEKRSVKVPDVPTIDESGLPGFRTNAWNGLMAPAGTPKPVVERIAAETARIVKEQEFAERLTNMGVEPVGSSPDEFAAMISADIALWAEALRIAGVTEQ